MTQTTSDPAPRLDRAGIARRAARDLVDGWTVNLGIGIPAMCADFLPDGVELLYHAENGVLGFEELAGCGVVEEAEVALGELFDGRGHDRVPVMALLICSMVGEPVRPS